MCVRFLQQMEQNGLLEQKSKLCIGAEWWCCSSLPSCGKGQQDLQHSLASMRILWAPQTPAQGFSLEGWQAAWMLLRSFCCFFARLIFSVTKILLQKSHSFLRFVLDYCNDTQHIKRICLVLWLASILANTAGFELGSLELTTVSCCSVSFRL